MTITFVHHSYCSFWCHNCDYEWSPQCTDEIPNHPKQCPKEKIAVCPMCGHESKPMERHTYIAQVTKNKMAYVVNGKATDNSNE